MTYKDELIKSMEYLSKDDRTIFIGQEADTFYGTMKTIPIDKIIETPIFEDTQLGISTGLSLEGYVPISLYTRMDFFILAMNQLVNHLDKIEDMSSGKFIPKVIVRVLVGNKTPIDPGPQHYQNYTDAVKLMVKNINIVELTRKEDIFQSYKSALESDKSTVLVELKELYHT